MAPTRDAVQTHTPGIRCDIASPEEFVSRLCCSDAGYSDGCEPSTHDDADDGFRDALLFGKEREAEGKQPDAKGSTQPAGTLPCSPTRCNSPLTQSTMDSPSLGTETEKREMIFKKLRNTPLWCTRLAAEPSTSTETTASSRSPEGALAGMLSTETPSEECLHRGDTFSQVFGSPSNFTGQVTEDLVVRKSDTCCDEASSVNTERSMCSPGRRDERVASQSKVSHDIDEHPAAESRNTCDKEPEEQVSSTLAEELPPADFQETINHEPRISKKRRCPAASHSCASAEDLADSSNGEAPEVLGAPQGGASGKDSPQEPGLLCTLAEHNPETPADEVSSVCLEAPRRGMACEEHGLKEPSREASRQHTSTNPLKAESSSTVDVESFATTPAEDVGSNQECSAVVQQNTTALIKRRRCGSLGLDQSLRWQAMARRVPRIKGVCYSTTRHEWIAVGPIQAGSTRKKNIYFSVPKHGFDRARRLAVECRRRLQAGVPVNVQEFVREQQLLFQSENTGNDPPETVSAVPDSGPPIEYLAFEETKQVVVSRTPGSPQSTEKRIDPVTPGPAPATTSGIHERSLPENLAIPASTGRRRQRTRALTFGSLQSDLAHRLLKVDGGSEDVHEPRSKERASLVQEALKAQESSRLALLGAPWHGCTAEEKTWLVLTTNKEPLLRESRSPARSHGERVLGKLTVPTRPTDLSGTSTRPAAEREDTQGNADNLEPCLTRRRGQGIIERDGTEQLSSFGDDSSYSTAGPLDFWVRQAASGSERPADTPAFASSASSEGGRTCSAGRSVRHRASLSKQTSQVEGQATSSRKICTTDELNSAPSAVFTTSDREKIRGSTDVCDPLPGDILQLTRCSSRISETPPAVNPFYQGTERPCKHQKRGKGEPRQQPGDSILADGCFRRRSSTTSSAAGHSAGAHSSSEPNGEYPQASKDSSDDSDPNQSTTPHTKSPKPWKQHSFLEEALLTGRASHLVRQHKKEYAAADNRRRSAASAVSHTTENVDIGGETAATEMACSPSDGRENLIDLLDPLVSLPNDDVNDPGGDCAVAEGSDLDGSHSGSIREDTEASVTTAVPYPAALGASGTALDFPVSPVYRCATTAFENGGERSSVSRQAPANASLVHAVEKASLDCHEAGVLEETNVLRRDSVKGMPTSMEGGPSELEGDHEVDTDGRESSDEKLPGNQSVAGEFSPLVKELCLMLVDLLRFCTCSPAALTRCGLHSSQVAFCKNEGIKVLRIALQDVAATRTISRRFRTYVEVFEDAILANALPTSGGAPQIMRYLYRLKQCTEGSGCPQRLTDSVTQAADSCAAPRWGGDLLKRRQCLEKSLGRDISNTKEHFAVRRTNGSAYERIESQNWSQAPANSTRLEDLHETLFRQVAEGDPSRESGKSLIVQDGERDMVELLNCPITSTLSSWQRTQQRADEETEQRMYAGEEKPRGQVVGPLESRCMEGYKASPLRYAHTPSQAGEQGLPTGVRYGCSRRETTYAKDDFNTGAHNAEKTRFTDAYETLIAALGGRLNVGKIAEHIFEKASSSSKTQNPKGELTSYAFRTWRQVVMEALQEAKCFEDLRRSEAMKQLLSLCVPMQSAAAV